MYTIKYLSILRLVCASSPALITVEERAISSTQRRLAAARARGARGPGGRVAGPPPAPAAPRAHYPLAARGPRARGSRPALRHALGTHVRAELERGRWKRDNKIISRYRFKGSVFLSPGFSRDFDCFDY